MKQPHFHFTEERITGLFRVDRDHGVFISTWQSRGIALYAGFSLDTYFLICALLGAAQWRVLESNPLLVSEDLIHSGDSRCLFTAQSCKQDYALLLEKPYVCRGCFEFFRCLGADSEMLALKRVLEERAAAQTVPGRSADRSRTHSRNGTNCFPSGDATWRS